MRISDWSSDVCSSDLALTAGLAPATLTTLGLLVARLVPARLTRAADGADVMGYPPLARLLTRIVPNMENRVRKCKPLEPAGAFFQCITRWIPPMGELSGRR